MPNTRDGLPAGAADALRNRWPALPWTRMKQTHGAFHVVLLIEPEAAIRVRMGPMHVPFTRSDVSTAQLLADADLNCPHALFPSIMTPEWSATQFTFISGSPLQPSTWQADRQQILSALDHLRRAAGSAPHLATVLPPLRSWCGGMNWRDIVQDITRSDSLAKLCDLALARVDAVLEAETAAIPTLVHGDFGPHNLLIDPATETPSMIDTDNAAWADIAINVAPLLNSYTASDLRRDFAPEIVHRAIAIKESLPLQVAAAAEIAGDATLRDHALSNFARRSRENSG